MNGDNGMRVLIAFRKRAKCSKRDLAAWLYGA